MGQGPGTSPDPQRCGIGQHRGFASPGSSPNLSEHPRPPRGRPSPPTMQTNGATAVVRRALPRQRGGGGESAAPAHRAAPPAAVRDQNPRPDTTGLGALNPLEDRGRVSQIPSPQISAAASPRRARSSFEGLRRLNRTESTRDLLPSRSQSPANCLVLLLLSSSLLPVAKIFHINRSFLIYNQPLPSDSLC